MHRETCTDELRHAHYFFTNLNPAALLSPMCPVCLTRNGPLCPNYGCCKDCESADLEAYRAFEDARYQDYRHLDFSDEYQPEDYDPNTDPFVPEYQR